MAAKICNVCNIRRAQTGSKGTEISPHNDMCNYCFEEGGQENGHSDGNHDGILEQVQAADGFTTELSAADKDEYESFMPTCWICHPELNLAKQASGASTGPKTQGTRRPQLNHKGHSHPATPAARRACKAAFWASLTPVANTSTNEQLAAAMQAWDCKLDGFGKPVPAPKSGWAGVVPQAKNGKANLKATQAKVDAVNASK